MSLVTLPVELFDQIISVLDTSGLASLMACDNRDLGLNHLMIRHMYPYLRLSK
jgi:hypothetical protein